MKLGRNQPISFFTFAASTLSQYGPLNLRPFFVRRWVGSSKASFFYSNVGRTALFGGLHFFLISTTSNKHASYIFLLLLLLGKIYLKVVVIIYLIHRSYHYDPKYSLYSTLYLKTARMHGCTPNEIRGIHC